MSSEDEGPVAWLRRQVEADLALARRVAARWVAPADHPRAGEPVWPAPSVEKLMVFRGEDPDVNAGLDLIRQCSPQERVADLEAKLAILDECDKAVRIARSYKDATGTLALAEAKTWRDAVRLVGSGYRHRPGYREEWKP